MLSKNKIKSGIGWFRKALYIKGRSEATKQGHYVMGYDCTLGELKSRIERIVANHPDMLSFHRNGSIIEVQLKIECVVADSQHYRSLRFDPSSKTPLICFFTR